MSNYTIETDGRGYNKIYYEAKEQHIGDVVDSLNEAIETIQSLQEENERLKQAAKPFPMLAGIPITQTTAELIFEMYSALYGNDQSLEKIKSRGGFGWDEVKHITLNFIKRFGRQRYELLIKDK